MMATSMSVLPTKLAARRMTSRGNILSSASPNLLRPAPLRSRRGGLFVVSAEPDVEGAIKEAQQACEDGTDAECATAWDTVEELSAAQAHKAQAKSDPKDPLEEYCEEVPEADECRVYEE